MDYQLNTTYTTRNYNNAVILYTMPDDVLDDFPFIGYVIVDTAKFATCWNRGGESSDNPAFDLINIV